MQTSRLEYIPLFRGLAVTTNGAALSKSLLDLDVPRFRNLLADCESIFLVALTENAIATDFEWNVAFVSGFDRAHEQPSPIDIAAAPFSSTAPNPVRSAPYTDLSKFLLDSRLQPWWRNQAGINGARSGVISCVLGALRWGR